MSREVHLVRRPVGRPVHDDVAVVEVPVPQPAAGQVVVRNDVMSVEPSMRGRMDEQSSYAAPYELGKPMTGPAVGRVVASGAPAVPVGSTVLHQLGWRDHALLDVAQADVVSPPHAPSPVKPSAWLGVLGTPGMTAWVGLTRVAALREGETVFISSAAGAVGAAAGQIARALGATTIGSAGSPEKVRRCVAELGYGSAFDYHDGPTRELLPAALAEVGREQLDVYFDNVGGEQLEAAIRTCGERARIALCGAISLYNATGPAPGPRNLLLLIWRRIRMEGFLVSDHASATQEFRERMLGWLADGTVRSTETEVASGISEAFDGFLAMLDGANYGKAVVRL